jgi:hypothetical protein
MGLLSDGKKNEIATQKHARDAGFKRLQRRILNK